MAGCNSRSYSLFAVMVTLKKKINEDAPKLRHKFLAQYLLAKENKVTPNE